MYTQTIEDLKASDPIPGADEPLGLVFQLNKSLLDLAKTGDLVKLGITGRSDPIAEIKGYQVIFS